VVSQNQGLSGHDYTQAIMKRISTILSALAAAVIFPGLVYAVLKIAHVSEPAAVTVHGATGPRLWASAAVVLGLGAAIVGGLAFARPSGRFGSAPVRAAVLVTGVIAAINGGLVLALAKGGPGTGNGVVGGAAALVLGIIAIALGIALTPARVSG